MSGPASHEADVEEFRRRVGEAAEGAPYVVERTERGYTLTLDVADARWSGVLHRAGVSMLVLHEVDMPEPGVYTVTDRTRQLTWVAGVPTVASGAWARGRIRRRGFSRVYALDETGRVELRAEHRYDTEEGRAMIAGVARQLHLTSRPGRSESIALAVGIVGGVGAVVTAVVLVVLALLGYFEGA